MLQGFEPLDYKVAFAQFSVICRAAGRRQGIDPQVWLSARKFSINVGLGYLQVVFIGSNSFRF